MRNFIIVYLLLSAIFVLSSANLGLRLWAALGIIVIGLNTLAARRVKRKSRYHRLKRNGGKHTEAEWKLLKFYYGNRCAYCHKRGVKLTKDHVIPVSKGGSDNIKNIVPACASCNSRKGNKLATY